MVASSYTAVSNFLGGEGGMKQEEGMRLIKRTRNFSNHLIFLTRVWTNTEKFMEKLP